MTSGRRRTGVILWFATLVGSFLLSYQGCLWIGGKPKRPIPYIQSPEPYGWKVDLAARLVEQWPALLEAACPGRKGTVPFCYRVWAHEETQVPEKVSTKVAGWAAFQFADGHKCAGQFDVWASTWEHAQTDAAVTAYTVELKIDKLRLKQKLEPPRATPPLRAITPGEEVIIYPSRGDSQSNPRTETFLVELPVSERVWVKIGRRNHIQVDVRVIRSARDERHEIDYERKWPDGSTMFPARVAGLYEVIVTEKIPPAGDPTPYTISVVWGDHWGTECLPAVGGTGG